MARLIGRKPTSFAELSGQTDRVSTVAIILSERGDSRIRWDLQIDATTLERGTVRVGRVLTIPPSYFITQPGGAVERAASRVVAIATCAQATSWKVVGTPRAIDVAPTDPEPIADCTITAMHAPISIDGVVPVYADTTGVEHADGVSGQLAVPPGVATLIAPYSPDRAVMRVSCADAPSVPILVGFTPSVLAQDYFVVPPGDIFETETKRAVWAFSPLAGYNIATWIESF